MNRPNRDRRVLLGLACSLTLATLALGAAPAAAHIQVRPNTAAPDDTVLWEVLVPNEREQSTTRVEVAIPPGVIPFSYAETPGWRRSLTLEPDDSVGSITWRGRLRSDGFARFAFLASTPPKDGEIAWKAIQTYDDGQKVRWIGPPDSETPAALTAVAARYPKQNAGGEGEGETAAATPAASESTAEDDGDESDSTARWLAGAALAVAIAGLVLAVLRRRTTSS
jgi:uncharacterized protein YcnI